MKQWILFGSDYLKECGYSESFYPFSHDIQQYGITTSHAGFISSGEALLYIGCKQARRHTDGLLNLPYVSILVLRNDGLIAKASRYGKRQWEPQVVGTVIVLNIHKLHHCIRDQRLPALKEGYWIGLLAEYAKKPCREKVDSLYRAFIETLCRKDVRHRSFRKNSDLSE